jgi:SPP1 family predicted phage head-tail adaptor
MIRSGQLKATISLERDTLTRVSGVETRTPAVYATVRAKAEPLSGREYWAAQEVNSETNWKFTLRYRTDVLSTDRVIYRGIRYEIQDVIPDEQKRTKLLLMCKGSAPGFVVPAAANAFTGFNF